MYVAHHHAGRFGLGCGEDDFAFGMFVAVTVAFVRVMVMSLMTVCLVAMAFMFVVMLFGLMVVAFVCMVVPLMVMAGMGVFFGGVVVPFMLGGRLARAGAQQEQCHGSQIDDTFHIGKFFRIVCLLI